MVMSKDTFKKHTEKNREMLSKIEEVKKIINEIVINGDSTRTQEEQLKVSVTPEVKKEMSGGIVPGDILF